MTRILFGRHRKAFCPRQQAAFDHGCLGDHVGVRSLNGPFDRPRGMTHFEPQIPEGHKAGGNDLLHLIRWLRTDMEE